MAKKIALKDIANKVGVSVALVSYVLNGKEKQARVRPEMAAKIRAAAAELNYQPNIIAQSLRSGRTNTIGLIVADISNPFFSNIARIIEDEAKKHGYVVIFGSSDENAVKQQDLIDVFVNRQVDAFIIAPTSDSEKKIRELKKRDIPVVLIDRYFPNLPIDCVRINNFQAAHKAVSQLIKNKRKRIAMVAYDSKMAHMQERKDGYRAALKKAGVRFSNNWLLEIDYQNLEGDMEHKLGSLLDPLQIDAVFFATNTLAVAGMKRINHAGIRIPDDLAVITFDENEAFDFFYCPITYVNQSLPEIGKQAVELSIARLKDDRRAPVESVIDAQLVLRESCGSKGPAAGRGRVKIKE